MALYADYSAGRPKSAALKKAGFMGVIRYIGGPNGELGSAGKKITAAEYQELVAGGITVMLVAEKNTTDAWGGYNNGVATAKLALAGARKLGIPDSVPIFCAADSHASNQAQINASVQFAKGFASVIGWARAGFYGFLETLSAVYGARAVKLYWRCGSNPAVADRAWIHLWQRNDGTINVSGIACDINVQYALIQLTEGIEGFMAQLTDAQATVLQNQISDIHQQLAGQTAWGKTGDWSGWPTFVYDVSKEKVRNLTTLDFIRNTHKAVFASASFKGRPVSDFDFLFGHVLSLRTLQQEDTAKLDAIGEKLDAILVAVQNVGGLSEDKITELFNSALQNSIAITGTVEVKNKEQS